jgi:hypothetical protein
MPSVGSTGWKPFRVSDSRESDHYGHHGEGGDGKGGSVVHALQTPPPLTFAALAPTGLNDTRPYGWLSHETASRRLVRLTGHWGDTVAASGLAGLYGPGHMAAWAIRTGACIYVHSPMALTRWPTVHDSTSTFTWPTQTRRHDSMAQWAMRPTTSVRLRRTASPAMWLPHP